MRNDLLLMIKSVSKWFVWSWWHRHLLLYTDEHSDLCLKTISNIYPSYLSGTKGSKPNKCSMVIWNAILRQQIPVLEKQSIWYTSVCQRDYRLIMRLFGRHWTSGDKPMTMVGNRVMPPDNGFWTTLFIITTNTVGSIIIIEYIFVIPWL